MSQRWPRSKKKLFEVEEQLVSKKSPGRGFGFFFSMVRPTGPGGVSFFNGPPNGPGRGAALPGRFAETLDSGPQDNWKKFCRACRLRRQPRHFFFAGKNSPWRGLGRAPMPGRPGFYAGQLGPRSHWQKKKACCSPPTGGLKFFSWESLGAGSAGLLRRAGAPGRLCRAGM